MSSWDALVLNPFALPLDPLLLSLVG